MYVYVYLISVYQIINQLMEFLNQILCPPMKKNLGKKKLSIILAFFFCSINRRSPFLHSLFISPNPALVSILDT